MSKKALFAFLFATVAIVSRGVYSRLTHSPHPKPVSNSVEAHIDPAIQGKERDVMRDVLQGIPEDQRENVTYVDEKGHVYGNKPSTRHAQIARPVGNGLYTYDGIEKFTLPGGSRAQRKTNLNNPHRN